MLVSMKDMLQHALRDGYAVGQFNINNLEWVGAVLSTAQQCRSPVILGVSGGTVKHMLGLKCIHDIVVNAMEYLHIDVPVALHLDHGTSREACEAAIAAGFSSIMFDGSHLPFRENLAITRHLVEHRWPFRLHATYDESISRMLDVFEKVNRDIPFNGLHWFFDHAETITERNIERVKALGGGIAVQHRMAFQGEYFVDRYGKEAVKHTPPVAKMLELDVPVGLGTDATRVASYNPWTALYWLVSGRTVGGMAMYDDNNRLPRDVALELWTAGSAWFSSEQGKKGRLAAGQLADLVVLSKDYFSVAEEEIKGIESVLTVVDGKVVYAAGHFSPLAPPPIPVLPEWSPVVKVPGHYRSAPPAAAKIGAIVQMHQCCGSCGVHGHQHDIARKSSIPVSDEQAFWGVLGCSCFAF